MWSILIFQALFYITLIYFSSKYFVYWHLQPGHIFNDWTLRISYLLWRFLFVMVFVGTPISGYVFKSFACSWDSFLILHCLVQIRYECFCLVLSYFLLPCLGIISWRHSLLWRLNREGGYRKRGGGWGWKEYRKENLWLGCICCMKEESKYIFVE